MNQNQNNVPKVGDGATMSVGSDCYPATVVKVSPSGKTVEIQMDEYTRYDLGGPFTEDQRYNYHRNPNGGIRIVRMTKRGWRIGGQRGTPVSFGTRRAYQDPSF